MKLALGVIALNIVVQAATLSMERSAHMQPSTAIAIGLWVGLAFYALVAVITVANRTATEDRLLWIVGDARAGLVRGLAFGGGSAALVLGLQKLVTHHLSGDPTVRAVVSDGSPWRIIGAVLLFVAVGPLIEELVFRGVLAESLRPRGIRAAVNISALLFALAHLRPGAIWYYAALGAMLGRLYFRHGMRSSTAAHAAFNGLLVGAALLSLVGPVRSYDVQGAIIHLPSTWQTTATPAIPSARLALRGPSGAEILVEEQAIPAGTSFDPNLLVQRAEAGLLPVPNGSVIDSGRVVDYPAGPAAVIDLTVDGHPGELAAIGDHHEAWVLVLSSGGSSRATSDFHRMLTRLDLTATN